MAATIQRATPTQEMSEAVCFAYDCLVDVMGLTPEIVFNGYCAGIFPMGIGEGRIKWYDPDPRAILPLDSFHVPKKLGAIVRQERFDITFDADFRAVITACAEREETWISPAVQEVYVKLHERGIAHSVEAWQEGKLVGGLYGAAIGGFFAGESMFYRVRNASHVALVHLSRHLQERGFLFEDCQFPSRHMEQFGAITLSREEYKRRLLEALLTPASF